MAPVKPWAKTKPFPKTINPIIPATHLGSAYKLLHVLLTITPPFEDGTDLAGTTVAA
jgi:hypothetical protein